MNLLKRLAEAWKETKEDLRKDLEEFRKMEKTASYYEYKELKNEEFMTMIFAPPIYYLANLFSK